MDNFRISDEYREKVLDSAAWNKVGVVLSEASRAQPSEVVNDEAPSSELDEGAEESVEEAIHVCPLCTCQLEDPIDEERLVEHLDVVLGLVERLSSLNEGEEDVEEVIDTALVDLLLGDIEEE